MGEIGSHIQMPRCALNYFVDENNQLYYIDIEMLCFTHKLSRDQNYVKKGHAKSLNTEKGYYSDSVEGMLSEMVEAPYGIALAHIANMDYSTLPLKIETVDIAAIRRFMVALICRGPKMQEALENKSIFYQFFPVQSKHDMAASGILEPVANNIFEMFDFSILVNESKMPFVLPVSGYYDIYLEGKPHIILPMNEHVAAVHHSKEVTKAQIENFGERAAFKVVDEGQIYEMNKRAVQRQYRSGYGYVVSSSKSLLEQLVSEIV